MPLPLLSLVLAFAEALGHALMDLADGSMATPPPVNVVVSAYTTALKEVTTATA
jgi:hypothetical protein